MQPPPYAQNMVYCRHCGRPIAEHQVVCPYCGIHQLLGTPQQARYANPAAKDRTVAILLAIFLGFWTWVYTYEVDSSKFWLNLVLVLVTCGFWLPVERIWAIVDVATRSNSFYDYYPNG